MPAVVRSTSSPPVTRSLSALDAVGDAVAELEVAGQLADPVVAVLDGGGGLGRGGLEAVEGLLHLVEHEVGGADADGAEGEEA